MMQKIPQFFYKYRGVDEKQSADKTSTLNYLLDQIKDDQLYFSTPTKFNDPFDCAPKIGLHSPSLSYEQFEQLVIQTQNTGKTEAELKVDAESMFRAALTDEWREHLLSELRKARVYCISTTCESILMWSHYASNHQGVCLEYENSGVFAEALPVMYQRDRPTQFYWDTSSPEKQVTEALLTKYEDWEYEQEWRIVKNESPKTCYSAGAQSLKRIILGAKIDDAVKAEIIKAAEGRKYRPSIVQAKLCDQKYSIVIGKESVL